MGEWIDLGRRHGPRRVVAEHDVGRGLADLASLPDDRHLLALASADKAALLLEPARRSFRVIARVEVGPDPVRIAHFARRVLLFCRFSLAAPPDGAGAHPGLGQCPSSVD